MNDWVLLIETVQEVRTKKTRHKPIFESFQFLNKEKIPVKKRKYNK
jgi:hypothetical protein